MPSFSIPLSGLNANSVALSAIANNLANLNTVGYKGTRPIFRDLFYQQIGSSGSGTPIQIGAGAGVGAIASTFTQGSTENTGVPTDIAIQQEGFFVVEKSGARVYTRAGNFGVDDNGYLITTDGGRVLGYPTVEGKVTPGDSLSALVLSKGQLSPPSPTSHVRVSLNLDARAEVGTVFSTPVAIYDALGASHVLNLRFTKTAANEWDYQVTIPAADVGQTGDPVVLKSGTLTFDGTGMLTSPTTDITGILISGFANGADDLSFDWNLSDGTQPVLTQLAVPSAPSSIQQDGFSSGTLLSFSIGSDGIIQGIFSNGQTQALGQIALATFPNLQGLMRTDSNNFLGTLSSGAPSIGAPGTGGRGTLSGGALELSNADISREFAQLILAQRGYQANARAVTTFDEITQETINLKR